MRSFYFSLVLFLLLFCGILLAQNYTIEQLHTLEKELNCMEEDILSENWQQAAQSAQKIDRDWHDLLHIQYITNDHRELSDLEGEIAQLEVSIRQAAQDESLSQCSKLQRRVSCILTEQSLSLSNIL